MLNFENLDGFVVDLSTPETVEMELENVLHNEEDRRYLKLEVDLQGLRDFILNYYISTYKDDYIFVKQQNVYQIFENELFSE